LQQKDKVRVYVLARELNMESKDLLELCRQAGIDVKNQLSSLDADQRDAVEVLVRRQGGGGTATATAVATAPPVSKTAVLAPPAPPASPALAPAAPSQPVQPAVPAAVIPRPIQDLGRVRDLNQLKRRPPAEGEQGKQPPPRKPEVGRPKPALTTPFIATPPKRKLPVPAKEEKKAEEPAAQKPLLKLTADESARVLKGGALTGKTGKEIAKEIAARVSKVSEVTPTVAVDDDEEAGKEGVRPGAVKGRDERHRKRSLRAKDRREREESQVRMVGTEGDEEARPAYKLRQRIRQPIPQPRGTQPRKGRVPVAPPITVRSLSEAVGVRANDLLRRLLERGQMVTINAVLEPVLAEEMALEFGAELEIKRPLDPEEQLLANLQKKDQPEDLVPRAPIVTIMGHVDHGKTSLLDRIRESNVVATEAGGITQHLRAWRVEHNGRMITFLDTPGHEAFTQMRARGANVTDIVVLVVAADDGLMPQTEEAISHAKAAGVPIVVAINKIDLPNANLNRTRQQLYGQGLIPDTMGGDTPFVETVATKERAKGIDELLDMLALVAELRELKANPDKPGDGTCLEAKLSEGEGVVATLLVRDGTLRRGDVVVCGATHGRVRAMYDDLGRPLEEAGPSWPVRITGLDDVPNADDKFNVVPELTVAREIAERRRNRSRSTQPFKNATFRLEDLDKTQVQELKLIMKADVRGSIEAIRKELEKLEHEEVRIHVLHAGIGAITEGDVQLALAAPESTLIVGFNVVPDDRAKALADEKAIQIRQYDIIYKLTDDLRAAMEGKLKPREEVVHLGRAIVRETYKISRVGTVAGCYVTQGVIERSARIRVIREGVVIYPPADRTASLDSLKRFKDDVRDVREGFECGIKVAGYDDIKVGDVIEAYRVEQVQRTL
jgi:translation initiation factor IF-2